MAITIDHDVSGDGYRIAIVAARFTADITELLVDSAIRALEERGVASDDITVAWVPGSFELPLICTTFAETFEYDGVIALGCVIRGETTHYDYVCRAAADGVLAANLDHGVPVIFGVLTTENREQAMARTDGTKGEKGAECAAAVLDMIGVIEGIHDS